MLLKKRGVESSVRCIFCGHISRPHWPEQNVWRCRQCTLIFRYPAPGLDELDDYYQEGWKQIENNTEVTGATDLQLARVYGRLMLNEVGAIHLSHLRLLEFGSGKGAMLTALAELGAEVYGVDPYARDFLRAKGYSVFSSLREIPVELKFHGIVTIQVIEHLQQPWQTLQEFLPLLHESGWVYISTINAGGLNARLNGWRWREAKHAGHLIFYSAKTIETLLAHCGYSRYERLKNVVVYPGRGRARRWLGHWLQRLSLGGELRYLAWKS